MNFDNFFQETGSNHRYPVRRESTMNYRVPKENTRLGRKKIQYDGATVWNDIPFAIKECKSMKHFSALFKAYLIHTVG